MSFIFYNTLIKRYAISDDEFNAILQIIIRIYTAHAVPTKNPTVVILGGQPGAGKTELQREAEFRLLKNAVICNADNFRDFHPHVKEIKSLFEDQYPMLTATYARQWNDELCLYCQQHKLNYILETTFSSGDRLNQTISEIKKAGYRVDIKLLAVDPRISRLGVYLRYEDMREKTTTGRKVSRQEHDLRFDAITDTIKKVQNAGLYDNLYIYTRTIVLEGIKEVDGVGLTAHNPLDPLKTYLEEVNRPWPEKAKLNFEKRCNLVLDFLKNRNASIREINKFKVDVGIQKGQSIRFTKGLKH